MKSCFLFSLVFVISIFPVFGEEEPWNPADEYRHEMGGEQPTSDLSATALRAINNLQTWAEEVKEGFPTRPLPLAGNWNTDEDAWSPNYYLELIREGQPVLITFVDPSSRAENAMLYEDRGGKTQAETERLMAEYYRPALEFARTHRLPIAFRGWNWARNIVDRQSKLMKLKNEVIPPEEQAFVMIGGKPEVNYADPFGPVKAWQDWGAFWLGNEMMRQIQEIYPDPPLVIFLNNNEAGEILISSGGERGGWTRDRVMTFDRLPKKFGDKRPSPIEVDAAVRDGYRERYEAMFEAGRAKATSPAWKSNIRFVAYNTLSTTSYLGNGMVPSLGPGFDPEQGFTKWEWFDGGMPEFYDNDWQLGKRDDLPVGMQAESGGLAAYLPRVFARDPHYLNTTIFWEGAIPADIDRGIRGTSKPFFYLSSGFRWDFERYEAWMQYCLWMARPSLAAEFRAREPIDAVRSGTWMALLDSLDRVWQDDVLREFWRNGELVPNRAEEAFHNEFPANAPAWIRELDRWYLLTSTANPPRESWTPTTRLSLLSLALVLGGEPERRWLVYAHAPQGSLSNVNVTIPGHGEVLLPFVGRKGSFFLVKEKDSSVEILQRGGPDEIRILEARIAKAAWMSPQWTAPAQPVDFTLQIGTDSEISAVDWDFGDGQSKSLPPTELPSHSYAEPGVYVVTAEAKTIDGAILRDQTAVHIGEEPRSTLTYDLPLNDAPDWTGPWQGIGEDGKTLATARLVPSRGQLGSAILTGGQFVDDPERGRVLELSEDHAGLFLARHAQTTVPGETGSPNRTISFWFNADDVEPRQVLYASGWEENGTNIYLDKGTLYAGMWAVVDGRIPGNQPRWGYHWNGEWIQSAPIEPNKWYQVTWQLENGGDSVEPDKQKLFVNGKLVGTAPGATIPPEYMPPRFGRTYLLGANVLRTRTRFHDQDEIDAMRVSDQPPIVTFRGKLDDAKFINAADGQP